MEYLLNYNEGSSKIGEFIEDEKLIKIEGEKKVKIVVKYKSDRSIMEKYSKIFLAIIVIGSIIIRLLKRLRNENKFYK